MPLALAWRWAARGRPASCAASGSSSALLRPVILVRVRGGGLGHRARERAPCAPRGAARPLSRAGSGGRSSARCSSSSRCSGLGGDGVPGPARRARPQPLRGARARGLRALGEADRCSPSPSSSSTGARGDDGWLAGDGCDAGASPSPPSRWGWPRSSCSAAACPTWAGSSATSCCSGSSSPCSRRCARRSRNAGRGCWWAPPSTRSRPSTTTSCCSCSPPTAPRPRSPRPTGPSWRAWPPARSSPRWIRSTASSRASTAWIQHAFLGFSIFAALNVALPLVGVRPGAALLGSAALAGLALAPAFRASRPRSAGRARWRSPWSSALVARRARVGGAEPGAAGAALPRRQAGGARRRRISSPWTRSRARCRRRRWRSGAGLAAYTAVHAPAGLRQADRARLVEGRPVIARVPLSPVLGGRARGLPHLVAQVGPRHAAGRRATRWTSAPRRASSSADSRSPSRREGEGWTPSGLKWF